MNGLRLVLRSLQFHARAHLGVFLGAAVGAAVLIGALIVGDSVRHSLRELAMARLGKIEQAMVTNDRLFQERLAEDLGAIPVFMLPGVAINSGSELRADRVQIVGVDQRFWELADSAPDHPALGEDQIILNETLAERLKAKVGDTIVVRVPRVSSLSRDAPMATQDDDSTGLRLKVVEVVNSTRLGRFSLQANQIPPYNAFVPLARLQERADAKSRANLLLTKHKIEHTALRRHWRLGDADLQVRIVTNQNLVELRSPRVFLDPPVVAAATNALPDARLIQTYFVDSLRVGGDVAFYSMVTAAGPPYVPDDMRDDEIVVNKLLASDIGANTGREIVLTYSVVGHGRTLETRTNSFRVRDIAGMEGPFVDPQLMPDFPGMTDAESCRDWDTGYAIDRDKLGRNDQDYWDRYRGTPKAFVSLNAGAAMWTNRFGSYTAVRFAPRNNESLADLRSRIETAVQEHLDPAALGFVLQPVREQALLASSSGQDFGGLFIGFSFFLIAAAMILVAMLFQFSVEQRSTEVGTLLAIGFTAKRVRNLLLGEGLGLATVGSLAGLAGGIWYARAMLHGLTTVWRDAVGTSELAYHAAPGTLIGGWLGSVAVAAFSLWLALRRQAARPARELLAGNDASIAVHDHASRGRGSSGRWIGIGATIGGLALTAWGFTASAAAAPGAFFGAGALLLIAGLCFVGVLLTALERADHEAVPTLTGLGVRNLTRRRKRSMATAIMLASGSFLVLSIGVFRLDETLNAKRRDSGTGGFAFLGDAAVPIRPDLNTTDGRQALGLDSDELKDVSFVQLRLQPGDDASCLNLNRAQRPRLLGVNPDALSSRGAFSFASTIDSTTTNAWNLLRLKTDDGTIPAIGDNASIMWALGKKVGDVLEYPDPDERGQPVRLKLVGGLANSILQGSLLIDESAFVEHFPSRSGYGAFLIDAPAARAESIGESLAYALRDNGLELTRATQRLAQLNAVQNTYLGTFQILGGLGLLLGSAGLGIVVLRNVLERRGELAVLLALGFRRGSLRRMILTEHVALLSLGLVVGIVAAVVAVIPALRSATNPLPYARLTLTMAGVFASGLVFTAAASLWALRGRIIESLRNN
jgi:putative ABC transport system permease protein